MMMCTQFEAMGWPDLSKKQTSTGRSRHKHSSDHRSTTLAKQSQSDSRGGDAGGGADSLSDVSWVCPQCLHEEGERVVGRRVAVWWPDDRRYYRGVVTDYEQCSCECRVLYDDGEWEFVYLPAEVALLDLHHDDDDAPASTAASSSSSSSSSAISASASVSAASASASSESKSSRKRDYTDDIEEHDSDHIDNDKDDNDTESSPCRRASKRLRMA